MFLLSVVVVAVWQVARVMMTVMTKVRVTIEGDDDYGHKQSKTFVTKTMMRIPTMTDDGTDDITNDKDRTGNDDGRVAGGTTSRPVHDGQHERSGMVPPHRGENNRNGGQRDGRAILR